MNASPDFLVRSPDDRTVLVVEVKNRPNASAEWAAQMRRNLAAHGVLPDSPFFLLALPDKFFLWKHASSSQAVPPDYEGQAQELLRPYLESLRSPVKELSESGFESIVRLWLEDLVQGTAMDQADWLSASGLNESIRHGVVTVQAAA